MLSLVELTSSCSGDSRSRSSHSVQNDLIHGPEGGDGLLDRLHDPPHQALVRSQEPLTLGSKGVDTGGNKGHRLRISDDVKRRDES
jgi:hypothetical protein